MPKNTLVFPAKEPDEDLDYQIDATTKIANSADTITGVTVAVAPNGYGEMTAGRIAVNGSFITVWLTGGIPARVYQVNVKVTTASGRIYEWPVVIPISPDLMTYPITPPDDDGFGVSVTWP